MKPWLRSTKLWGVAILAVSLWMSGASADQGNPLEKTASHYLEMHADVMSLN